MQGPHAAIGRGLPGTDGTRIELGIQTRPAGDDHTAIGCTPDRIHGREEQARGGQVRIGQRMPRPLRDVRKLGAVAGCEFHFSGIAGHQVHRLDSVEVIGHLTGRGPS